MSTETYIFLAANRISLQVFSGTVIVLLCVAVGSICVQIQLNDLKERISRALDKLEGREDA